MFALYRRETGKGMSLTRREILEQLARLGIRELQDLKKACREFEVYWVHIQCRM